MTVYVDSYNALFRGKRYCHMMADTDGELEEIARSIGLKKEWRHGDHYDVSPSKKKMAIKNGAIQVDSFELVKLRQRKRCTGCAGFGRHDGCPLCGKPDPNRKPKDADIFSELSMLLLKNRKDIEGTG